MEAKKWKTKIKGLCKKAGTYEPYFDYTIDSLAALLEKRDQAQEMYEATGSKPVISHTNKAGAANLVKNPCLVAWTDLNTAALAYWRDLGLTPSAYKKTTGGSPGKDEKGSALVEALKALS